MGGRTGSRELLLLGIRGVPAAHGGFETFAERLVLWLRDRGWRVTVFCQGSATGRREADEWEGVRRVHVPVRRDGAAGTVEFDIASTREALAMPGLILTLGYNTGFLSSWVRARGRRNVINMDGLEWKRRKYGRGARAYLWLNERLAARAGDRLIADHPSIADHLATRAPRSRIVMIPYGSEEVADADPALLAPLGLANRRFATLIARPEPENSVLEIVRAWSARRRDVTLAVLGAYARSHSYQASVLDAAGAEILFPGAIYDKPTLAALRLNSVVYCHGHQVGGTNPSLVEALGAGGAVVAHDNPFNRWVAGEAGRYFRDETGCAALLDALLDDEATLAGMRGAARARWRKEFTWPAVLGAYEALLTEMDDGR